MLLSSSRECVEFDVQVTLFQKVKHAPRLMRLHQLVSVGMKQPCLFRIPGGPGNQQILSQGWTGTFPKLLVVSECTYNYLPIRVVPVRMRWVINKVWDVINSSNAYHSHRHSHFCYTNSHGDLIRHCRARA